MSDSKDIFAEMTALADWATSDEGIAAARAATEFARRTGLGIRPDQVCAIVVAAHEAEEAVRRRKGRDGTPGSSGRPENPDQGGVTP